MHVFKFASLNIAMGMKKPSSFERQALAFGEDKLNWIIAVRGHGENVWFY